MIKNISAHPREILIATSNAGKIREFEVLLTGLPLEIRGLSDFAVIEPVAETGSTFAANARLKALGYASQAGVLTLADDSGLEVAGLGGAPGVFSARFGGAELSDAERAEKLLGELKKSGDAERKAKFICVIVLADQTGRIWHEASGVCDGRIAVNACGNNGFGYDPIFVPDGFSETFAALPPEIKHKISHRGRAMSEMTRFLLDFFTN